MSNLIANRGPDSHGLWVETESDIALAHRRLAIIDLSEAGHQPISDRSGRLVLCFNGEIYNHQGLRLQLAAESPQEWRGTSDSETLVEAIRHWGIVETLRRCNGMFAFALWDRKEKSLTLARDRLGEKPLYWTRAPRGIAFASTLGALRTVPGCPDTIDMEALSIFLRTGYIPAPRTVFRDVLKLKPGHMVQIAGSFRAEPVVTSYWAPQNSVLRRRVEPYVGDINQAIDELDHLITDAVGLRMAADVPMGAFLSGGVDSSLVVAMMQKQSKEPINTFTIGHADPRLDESQAAARTARHLGTNHSTLILNDSDLREVVPRLPAIWDEPFADSSQIPTYLVSSLARGAVTVALSGDGGDETFCGYGRYSIGHRLYTLTRVLPIPLQKAVRSSLQWSRKSSHKSFRTAARHRVLRAAGMLGHHSKANLYQSLISDIVDAPELLPRDLAMVSIFAEPVEDDTFSDFMEEMMFADLTTYLPDDILCKVDRASMAVGLEARVPLLDPRIIDFAWSLPQSFKVRRGQKKWILRAVLARYLPPHLIDQQKMGFRVPLAAWLSGPLRDWAEALFAPQALESHGLIDSVKVQHLWREFLSGNHHLSHLMWRLLMFQSWYQMHCKDSGIGRVGLFSGVVRGK